MFGDILQMWLLWLKGALFLLLGALAATLLLWESPSLRVAGLLTICVWSFCRAYYFAFYVIEKYADPAYRFAGLGSFAAYAWRNLVSPRGHGGTEN